MKLRDEEGWKSYEDKNSKDFYSLGVVNFSKRWAELMEKRIEAGERLEDFAKKTSREADTEGITGFMYGCAVSVLSQFWIYGEELRCWHNLDTQLGDEGEKANEVGTVLNPALLAVGKEK
jgi:hypothetical protein